ncbi:MAG: flagellar basal body rod protein FlgB [Salinarimonas sp.]
MSVAGLPLIEKLKTRMHWHQARQKLIAENVANADTPGFKPRDVAEPRLDARGRPLGGVQPARTVPGHLALDQTRSGISERNAARFEVRPSGNAVNLEDEMLKSAQNQADYQLAASLYEKSLQMLRIAAGRR